MNLSGKNILVTRPEHQSGDFVALLEKEGACATSAPTIKVIPSKEQKDFQQALKAINSFDWIIFTSVNGVKSVEKEFKILQLSNTIDKNVKLAAIGPATAQVLKSVYRAPDCMPEEFIADRIPELLGDIKNKKILLPRADIARKNLPLTLRELGAHVTEVAAYSVTENDNPEIIKQIEKMNKPHYITATSPSTIKGLKKILTLTEKLNWLHEIPVACIGPITAKTAEEIGCSTRIVASEYTTIGLRDAIIQWERKQND